MLQSYVTPLFFGLVATVHVVCAVAAVLLVLAPMPRFPGWQVVKPGRMHWVSFVGSWAFSALMTWIWLFVGSARCDAKRQMFYALLLIGAFGAGAAWSGFYIRHLRRTALRWLGTEIRWQKMGREISQEMEDFDACRRGLDGSLQLSFRDGTILKLDPHAQNAVDLISEVFAAACPVGIATSDASC